MAGFDPSIEDYGLFLATFDSGPRHGLQVAGRWIYVDLSASRGPDGQRLLSASSTASIRSFTALMSARMSRPRSVIACNSFAGSA